MSLLLLSKIKRSSKLARIRKYTNLLYYDPNFVNLDMRNVDLVEVDGCKFWVTDQINSIQRVKGNPWFEKVRSTDVVVDIGANIGTITIPLAKVARKVYAMEPLFCNELDANVKLNNLTNVTTLKCGIGKICTQRGQKVGLMFSGREERVPLVSFKTLKKNIGEPIDFLKLDCEGCEWTIEPIELKGIRELRIEFHIQRGKARGHKRKYREYLSWIEAEGYEVHIEQPYIGPNPYDVEDYLVRASLK